MSKVPAVGARFELAEEGIFGCVDSIIDGPDGEPASLVIEMDDGRWAAIDLSAIEIITPTVH